MYCTSNPDYQLLDHIYETWMHCGMHLSIIPYYLSAFADSMYRCIVKLKIVYRQCTVVCYSYQHEIFIDTLYGVRYQVHITIAI